MIFSGSYKFSLLSGCSPACFFIRGTARKRRNVGYYYLRTPLHLCLHRMGHLHPLPVQAGIDPSTAPSRGRLFYPNFAPLHGGPAPRPGPARPGSARNTAPASSGGRETDSTPAPAPGRCPPSAVFYRFNGAGAVAAQPLHRPAQVLDLPRKQDCLDRLRRGGPSVPLPQLAQPASRICTLRSSALDSRSDCTLP